MATQATTSARKQSILTFSFCSFRRTQFLHFEFRTFPTSFPFCTRVARLNVWLCEWCLFDRQNRFAYNIQNVNRFERNRNRHGAKMNSISRPHLKNRFIVVCISAKLTIFFHLLSMTIVHCLFRSVQFTNLNNNNFASKKIGRAFAVTSHLRWERTQFYISFYWFIN